MLPEGIDHIYRTGSCGLKIVPPWARDCQVLWVFDAINDKFTDCITVEGWEQLRPDSYICRPIGFKLDSMFDQRKTIEGVWPTVNKVCLGRADHTAVAMGKSLHAYPLDLLANMDTQQACEDAARYHFTKVIHTELDDPQYMKDWRFMWSMHQLSFTEISDYIGIAKRMH